MSFSTRMGLTPQREAIQLSSMDEALRIALYNYLFDALSGDWYGTSRRLGNGTIAARSVWGDLWRHPVDEFPNSPHDFFPILKDFVLTAEWYDVYDLAEYLVVLFPVTVASAGINSILEREMSGYRLQRNILVPVSDGAELSAIDEALDISDRFKGAREHIEDALRKLSQKPTPDLRNAITEAVSAVESAARIVAEKPKATLGDALKCLEQKGHLHPALKEAWAKLYGYTSDEQGLRHAMTEDPNIDFPTGKYMVVSCAAFVNLLSART